MTQSLLKIFFCHEHWEGQKFFEIALDFLPFRHFSQKRSLHVCSRSITLYFSRYSMHAPWIITTNFEEIFLNVASLNKLLETTFDISCHKVLFFYGHKHFVWSGYTWGIFCCRDHCFLEHACLISCRYQPQLHAPPGTFPVRENRSAFRSTSSVLKICSFPGPSDRKRMFPCSRNLAWSTPANARRTANSPCTSGNTCKR